MHWSGLNGDLKHLLKHIFGGEGANLSKIELTKIEKWSKISNQI